MSFSTYIKDKRKENNLTQAELAKQLDISTTAVKLIEYENTKYPSKKVLTNLARIFSTTVLDVMHDIIFSHEDFIDKRGRYLASRYSVMLYLKGWNIKDSPIKYEISNEFYLEFGARLTMKRQPKNIVIICSYVDHFLRLSSVNNEQEAFFYMSDLESQIMMIVEKIRAVHLVFDSTVEEDVKAYNYFKYIKFGNTKHGISIVLIDPIIGSVIAQQELIL